MQNLKIIIAILLSVTLVTVFISCGAIVNSSAKNKLTVENGAIPPNYNTENTILLLVTHRKNYNKYLEANAKSDYKGKYELVTSEELKKNEKYKNFDTYKYLFDYDTGASQNMTLYSFYIQDRKSWDRYKCPIVSSYWSKIQKVYFQKLSEEL